MIGPCVTLHEMPSMPAADWDRMVAPHPDCTIFHLACWHACLDEFLPGRMVRFAVSVAGEHAGYWCGFLVRKFGLRVFGAPLPGSATDYMHPLCASVVPVGPFLDAVSRWARTHAIDLVELGGGWWSEQDLAAHGYETRCAKTYRIDLSGGEDEVWKRLKPAMRNKIRKAEKSHVVVAEDCSSDFPRRFFDMLKDVFNRQGMAPTYSLRRIETVVRVLGQSGNFVGLTAWLNGEALASVILLVDGRAAYFWGGASYRAAYPVGANDNIHWHAMKQSIARGLQAYDTCGGGDYKEKFGGQAVALPAGHLPISPTAGVVRAVVRRGFRTQQVVRGLWQRLGKGSR
jgi:hypothetical protein